MRLMIADQGMVLSRQRPQTFRRRHRYPPGRQKAQGRIQRRIEELPPDFTRQHFGDQRQL
jgi:hypothetical protein